MVLARKSQNLKTRNIKCSLYIIICVSWCLSVGMCPINAKPAEPIGTKFCLFLFYTEQRCLQIKPQLKVERKWIRSALKASLYQSVLIVWFNQKSTVLQVVCLEQHCIYSGLFRIALYQKWLIKNSTALQVVCLE